VISPHLKVLATDIARSQEPEREAGSFDSLLDEVRLGCDWPSFDEITQALHRLKPRVEQLHLDPTTRLVLKEAARRRLIALKISSPGPLLDTVLSPPSVVSNKSAAIPNSVAARLVSPDPWHEAVNGPELVQELAATFRRFVVLPPEADTLLAFWALHTHAFAAAEVSPILAIVSPEKRCGKTRLIEVLNLLTSKPLPTSNITGPALFRTVEKYQPTLLVDEADSFIWDDENLRGILNSGHRKETASVMRLVGENYEPCSFGTWCPKVIAAIKKLPATVEDRSIMVRLNRKSAQETVERFYHKSAQGELSPLCRKAARWVKDNADEIAAIRPSLPKELNDRQQDIWEPLLVLADVVGGHWPGRARMAAIVLCCASSVDSDDSAGPLLLADLRQLFEAKSEKISSKDIVEALGAMEERPWPEWKNGRPITARQLASLLKPFGVRPAMLRTEDGVFRGYEMKQFIEVFARYAE